MNNYKPKANVIGVIPEYPQHSKQNIYGHFRLPPVGIVSVLTHIRETFGHNVLCIDENNFSGPRKEDGSVDHQNLQNRRPADVAMLYGGMTNSIPRMFSVASKYKRFGALTIAGGSHVDAMPKEALDNGVDIVVHGEGDITGTEIMQAVIKDGAVNPEFRRNLEGILGISYKNEDGQVIFTGNREPITNLDELADPDLTIISHLQRRWNAIPISMGRGCNYGCEFCVVNDQYGRYKRASPNKGVEQIIRYSDMGYKFFFIVDDNFTQNTEAAIDFCKTIGDYRREFNKDIRLMVQVRTETAENDELVAAMRYAGVHTLAIGVESPIDEDLRAMKKGVTVDKLRRRLRKLADNFYVHQMYIFGYPAPEDAKYDSGLSLREKGRIYRKFFRESRGDTIQVLCTIPLPGTRLRERLKKEGRIREDVGWEFYDGMHVCITPKKGEDEYDLQAVPQELMAKWYLGGPFGRTINYGNWMNWAYNATIGFPIKMTGSYAKRLIHNSMKKARGSPDLNEMEKLVASGNVFYASLKDAWRDTKRTWRNLAIRTYAGGIVKRWAALYQENQDRGLI